MTLRIQYLSPILAGFFAHRYIAAVKNGKPFGVSTLRAVLKREGWSIFGINNSHLHTYDAHAIAAILEAFAFRASGPLADVLRANDAEDSHTLTLAGK
ncbi:MAG: hypothetical protein FWD64_02565 [Acidobacteriaceae bacterium]|nr:hypothetical protein [Acidobacteriaceae bacterium]